MPRRSPLVVLSESEGPGGRWREVFAYPQFALLSRSWRVRASDDRLGQSDLRHAHLLSLGSHPASLEPRKIYLRIHDPRAEEDGFLRVVDESGEDYLYPSRLFAAIEVPAAVERAFAGAG